MGQAWASQKDPKGFLHVAWIHLVVVGISAGVFTAVWPVWPVAGFGKSAGIGRRHYERVPRVVMPT